MSQGWREPLAGTPGIDYHLYCDLGAVRDPTVIAVGHELGGVFFIDRLVTLQGSPEQPVLIATVEATIRQLAEHFHITRGRIESWQGLSLAQSLASLGCELFTPTAKANAEEWPTLAYALASGTLVLPPHPRLREELLGLVYEQGPSGVRVTDKGSGVHQDHAVCVRGVVASLTQDAQDGPVVENVMDAEEYEQLRAALPGFELPPEQSNTVPAWWPR